MSKWLSNLSVRWKILFVPAFLIVVLMAIGAYALYVQRDAQSTVDRLMTGPATQVEMIADLNTAMWTAQTNLYRLTATAANETDQKKISAFGKRVSKIMSDISDKLKAFESLKGLDKTTQAKTAQMKAAVVGYMKQAKSVIDMVDTDPGTALAFMMGAQRSFDKVVSLADDITDNSKQAMDFETARTNAAFERQGMMLIGVLLCVVVIGCAVSFIVARIIAKPVVTIAKAVDQIAQGDLDVEISASSQRDEVGQIAAAVAKMAQQVRATVAEIKNSAREVTNASSEIAGATTDLSQRTEEQAASLGETSAAMEELASTVRKNAENAEEANRLALDTCVVADRGGGIAGKAIEAMTRIEESSRKVTDIIGVIDEIARQTNLLALNAAVEAARAGEAGRGFAVVASEVRTLAQRSSEAAKDIKQLISNSGSQVHDGVELVNQTGTALSEIADSVKKAASIISEIAAASSEQATGLDQINKAINQMDGVTQQNSALVEENAATAKTLEFQERAMAQRVAFFRFDETETADELPTPTGGDQPAPARPARPRATPAVA
jgi:methyl-accepting chemotaxis protein